MDTFLCFLETSTCPGQAHQKQTPYLSPHALQLPWGHWCWDWALHSSLPSTQFQQPWGLPWIHVPLLLHSFENIKMIKLLLNIRTGKGQVERQQKGRHKKLSSWKYISTSVLRTSKQGRYLSILLYQTNEKGSSFYIPRLGTKTQCNSRVNM